LAIFAGSCFAATIAGFRRLASSLLLLGPLFLLVLYRAPIKYKVSGLNVLALAVAAWFVPMLRASARDFYPKWGWILTDE
jgi:hypothetical protein